MMVTLSSPPDVRLLEPLPLQEPPLSTAALPCASSAAVSDAAPPDEPEQFQLQLQL